MKDSYLIFIPLLMLLLAGCGQRGEMSKQSQKSPAEFASSPAPDPKQNAQMQDKKPQGEKSMPERKIIKTGTFIFETNNADTTRKKTGYYVRMLGGYLASEEINTYNNRLAHNLNIRIPAENFDTLLMALSQQAKIIERRSIQTQDVTEEFVDVKARLSNKRKLENRYQELLKQAGSVEEILQVEKELSNVREEIEAAEGRLQYLRNRVAYSSLRVRYYEKIPSKFGFGHQFADALGKGWNNLLSFSVFLVKLWPFLIIIIIGIAWITKRKKNRKTGGKQ